MTWGEMKKIMCDAIMDDLMGRRGFRHLIEGLDEVVQLEIRDELGDAALTALRDAGVRFMPAEATEEMQRCGGAVLDHPSVYMGGASPRSMTSATAVYRAMRSAGEIKPESGK